MIKYLAWDSDFFDHKIGKLTYREGDEWPTEQEFRAFDLVYIFSNTALDLNYPLYDIKFTFYKETQSKLFPASVYLYDNEKHDYIQLQELVFLSGHDSRFRKDPFFGEQAFKNLYKAWIDKSLNTANSKVLVYEEESQLLGFIAIKEENNKAFIDLIAVIPEAQGKGVGHQLVDAVDYILGDSKMLYVPTQQTNAQACHFYEKCGFKISDKHYIYHYAKDSF